MIQYIIIHKCSGYVQNLNYCFPSNYYIYISVKEINYILSNYNINGMFLELLCFVCDILIRFFRLNNTERYFNFILKNFENVSPLFWGHQIIANNC